METATEKVGFDVWLRENGILDDNSLRDIKSHEVASLDAYLANEDRE